MAMITKDERRLRIALVGCGPISQAAHLDAIRKASNAELFAICDVARDLTARIAAIYQPKLVYNQFSDVLADPNVDAVVIAVADQFHVPLCKSALAAGKHVLIEKPLGTSVEECESLRGPVESSGVVFQIGNNRRFEPGMTAARRFVREEIGAVLTLDAWYYDSIYRYTMQDNLYPVPVQTAHGRRPPGNWKADRERYLLLTHGAHLADTARFLGGAIDSVRAQHVEHGQTHAWSIEIEFQSGTVGHLELISPRQGDFEEGFRVHGSHGSVNGVAALPWFQRARVECFKDGEYRRLLGADGYTFRRQIEGFAATILDGAPQHGADLDDGIAAMRALVAISQSVASSAPVWLAQTSGPMLSSQATLATAA
jgi:predicted dehydrogenase